MWPNPVERRMKIWLPPQGFEPRYADPEASCLRFSEFPGVTDVQEISGYWLPIAGYPQQSGRHIPAAEQQLDVACALVRHSHEEARRSIATLRPESLDSIGLPQALESCARRMVDGGTVQVTVSIFGDLRTIPVRISDTLFRIGQEAIANAIRHASPSNLNICLSYENSSVQLVIESSIPNASTATPPLGVRSCGARKAPCA